MVIIHWATAKKLSTVFLLIFHNFDMLIPKITLVLLNQVNIFSYYYITFAYP